jgi:hypothetical protein
MFEGFAMNSVSRRAPDREHTPGQVRLRNRLGGHPLRRAVRMAVHSQFGFTHRAGDRGALWSGREQVWLGRTTFLHWALNDDAIDIPWLVGEAIGAGETDGERREAIHKELLAVWRERLQRLPSKSTPAWLPLP